MALAFGGACPDRAPADQVGHVLRADQVEELGTGRQAHWLILSSSSRARLRPFADLEALVQVRIVDQALPADRGARLLRSTPASRSSADRPELRAVIRRLA